MLSAIARTLQAPQRNDDFEAMTSDAKGSRQVMTATSPPASRRQDVISTIRVTASWISQARHRVYSELALFTAEFDEGRFIISLMRDTRA